MTQAVHESTTVTIVGGGVSGLIAALLADGADLRFEAADVALHGLDGPRPLVSYVDTDGRAHEIECDVVAGCWLADMMHGASGSPVGGGSFRMRIMRARLERLLSSETAARYYAEMFTGLG